MEQRQTKKAKYVFGGLEFTSKSRALSAARTVLNNGEPGTTLNPQEDAFMRDYIKGHPKYYTKTRKGVAGFKREKFPDEKYQHLEIIHDDGSSTSFSIKTCLDSQYSIHKTEVRRAFRQEVEDQRMEQKCKLFQLNPVCAVSGVKLEWEDANLDHYPKAFVEIVEEFMQGENLDYDDIRLITDRGNSDDGFPRSLLKDAALGKRFERYHLKVAEYRLLHKTTHNSLSGTGNNRRKKGQAYWES